MAQDTLEQGFTAAAVAFTLTYLSGMDGTRLSAMLLLHLITRTLGYAGSVAGMELLGGACHLLSYATMAHAFFSFSGLVALSPPLTAMF